MALEPLSIKNMEEKTEDIYEAVVVMSKRAKQILSDRVVDENTWGTSVLARPPVW